MTTAPKERPILFRGEMVKAILDGRKTQTRRVMNPQLVAENGERHPTWQVPVVASVCPYGKPGESLWVRETWKPHCEGPISDEFPLGTCVKYRADGVCLKPTRWNHDQGYWCESQEETARWRPSIYMPRWASRITLEIVSVGVERVCDITPEDAIAEGIATTTRTSVDCFAKLWDSINGKKYPWVKSPWVWRIEFKRV